MTRGCPRLDERVCTGSPPEEPPRALSVSTSSRGLRFSRHSAAGSSRSLLLKHAPFADIDLGSLSHPARTAVSVSSKSLAA